MSAKPGKVFISNVRKVGRRKNAGSLSWLHGQMVVCIGYTEDGLTAAYATVEQIEAIKRAIHRERKSPAHKLLLWLISHYEKNMAK